MSVLAWLATVVSNLVVAALAIALGVRIAMRLSPWFAFRVRLAWVETRAWLQWKVAYLLPRSVALLAFVRVYSVMDCPGPEYAAAYKQWEAGKGR